MAEGTKLGPDEIDFEKRVSKEKSDLLGQGSKATKIGELSEFEKELYAEGADSAEETPEVETPKVEEVSKATKVSKKSDVSKEESVSGDDMFEQEVTESIFDYQEGDIVKGVVRQIEKTVVRDLMGAKKPDGPAIPPGDRQAPQNQCCRQGRHPHHGKSRQPPCQSVRRPRTFHETVDTESAQPAAQQ